MNMINMNIARQCLSLIERKMLDSQKWLANYMQREPRRMTLQSM